MTNSYNGSNVTGCCILGLFLGIVYGIWRIVVFIARIIWRAVPPFFTFLYYFYAWPLLLFEYLWKRGGMYRIGSMIVLAVLVITFISLIWQNSNAPLSPDALQAARARTRTATITHTRTKPTITRTRPKPTITRTQPKPTITRTQPKPTVTQAPSQTVPPTVASGVVLNRPSDTQAVRVVRVVDGDTVVVDIAGTETRLRLIGIDTPEVVDPRKPVQCFGVEASNYTKSLLTNQTIYIERDASQDEYDKYNRLLVYIWLDDTTLFNYQIIQDGYAFEYTYNLPYRYQALFKGAQQSARSNNNGLWSPSTCNGNVDPQTTTTASTAVPTSAITPTATMTALEQAFPCQIDQIKGNPDSMIYHIPTGQSYAVTRNSRVVCFDSETDATAAGYRKASR